MKITLKSRPINHTLSFDEINVYGNFYNAPDSKYEFGEKDLSQLNKYANKVNLFLHEDSNGFHLSPVYRKDHFAGVFTLYENCDKYYDNIENHLLQFISTLRKYNYGKIKETVVIEDNKEVFTYEDGCAEDIAYLRYGFEAIKDINIIHDRRSKEEKQQWKKVITNQWVRKA
jgi:hypothetical protein